MSDPMTSLRDRMSVLGLALAQWADRGTARDKAAARRAGSTAVDAIDALLRDLYLLRGRTNVAGVLTARIGYARVSHPRPASRDPDRRAHCRRVRAR